MKTKILSNLMLLNMKSFFFLLLVISTISCTERINPIPPEAGTLNQIEYKESSVTLPIRFEIDKLQKLLNDKVPNGLIYHLPNGISGFFRSDVHVYRSGNISFNTNGNKLRFAIPIRITGYGALRKNILGVKVTKTGRGEARTVLYLDVNLNLNQDYTFLAKSNLNYDLQKAKIRISLLGDIGKFLGDPHMSISIRSFLRPILDSEIKKALPDLNGLIESELNKFDLKTEIQKYWSELGKPIRIAENVWVSSNPQNIQFNNIASSNQNANIKIGLSSVLKMKVGSEPESFDSEIPNLAINQLKEGSFNIYLPAIIEFSELNNKVNGEIAGNTYYSDNKKHKVTINNVQILGTKNREAPLSIAVDFKGKIDGIFSKIIKGKLWFEVSPKYDKETGTVYLDNLQLTPETNSALVDKAIPWLIDQFYMDELLEKAKIDLSKEINSYKKTINDEISDVRLSNLLISGSLEELKFEGFKISENQLELVISAEGELNSMFSE